ncbi:MAG TPA: PAS domain S-box protein, partial [Bacteroidales bacterium]|nr:PAS domain S-box protein [Bacteroidales bacterium]
MNKKSDNIPDQFFSNSINLIWIADNDGFFIQVNSEWEQILGYSSSQLTGKRFSDFVHPDEVEETDRIIRLAHTQPVHNFRNRFKHQDGSFHWLEWNSLSSGNLIFASARDITYYEKTKNAIKESKSGLYSFIDRSSEGIVITDEQGVIEAWNKSAELITGMPREDTYGKYCWDVAYSFFQEPEQGSLVREDINKELFNALTTGQLDIQSDDFHRIQLSDGKFKYVKHKVFTFKTDFGFRIGIVFTDITEHLTLKESEEKYRTLVENMEDAVFRADLNGVINFTNPSAARLLGCPSPKSIIGLKINDFLYYPDDSIKQYNALKEKGKLSKYEVTLKRMDNGNPVLVLANTQFYRDAKDQIIGIEGVYNEITERKKVEEALQKRVLALTKPIDDPEGVKFTDLFDLEELQKVQDTFSDATGVASIITYPDGTTITKPSNFCRLCNLIRSTEKGISDCLKSDVLIGEQSFNRPAIQPCLSGGLLNAGANITIGGKHVANWLIGQIRNEVQDENKVLEYAYAIGADPEQFKEALQEVPSMSEEQFEKVAQSLYVLANQLSLKAYQNVQQARFIAGQKKAEQELATAKAVLDTAFTQTPIPMILVYHTKKKNNLHVKNKASDELLGQLTETNYHGRTISKMNITWQFYDEFGNYVPHINTPIVMALNGTETKNKIFSIKRSDGTLRWTSVSATPIRNNAGEIIGAFQIFPDITVRKTAEEKVKQLAEMHQTILDTITTGLTFMKNRKHIWVNAACCKIFGYKIEEIVNVGSSYMFASKEDYEKVGVEGYKELGKGNIYSEEFQLKKKDGKLFWGRIV